MFTLRSFSLLWFFSRYVLQFYSVFRYELHVSSIIVEFLESSHQNLCTVLPPSLCVCLCMFTKSRSATKKNPILLMQNISLWNGDFTLKSGFSCVEMMRWWKHIGMNNKINYMYLIFTCHHSIIVYNITLISAFSCLYSLIILFTFR